LFGLHNQSSAASCSTTAARVAAGSSAQPSAAPSRGTVTTVAPRCSVRTRYIAYVGVGTTARPPAGMKTLAAISRISSAPAPTRISAGVTPYRAAAASTSRR